MSDSEDELFIDLPMYLPTKEWPTKDEVDEIVFEIVTKFAEQGNHPADLKLRSVLKQFNKCGFTGNFMVKFSI